MRNDPFHDLFHVKVTDAHHTRMTSVGAGSFSLEPSPVCIDSIQHSHNCTSTPCHLAHRPGSGTPSPYSGSTPLFSLRYDCSPELERCAIPDHLRSCLEQIGVRLSEHACSAILHSGRTWIIRDLGRRFSVKKLAFGLTVYREPE